MLITIIILVLSAVFFVNGKIRSDLVALCALVALLIFQILTPDEALSGFSNSVVIMMVGLFVVDFFYFSLINFPIFNVADIYVTVAAFMFIILGLFYYKEEDFSLIFPDKKHDGKHEN